MEEEERIFRNYIFVDTNRVERFFTLGENPWLMLLLFGIIIIQVCVYFFIFLS